MANPINRFPKGTITTFNIITTDDFLKGFLTGDKSLFENNTIDFSNLYRSILYSLKLESPRLARTLLPLYNCGVETREQFLKLLQGLEKSSYIKIAMKVDTTGDISVRIDRSTKPWIVTV